MNKGIVKFFHERKGWGFIADSTGEDIFVHYTGISMDGRKRLVPGQNVKFDVTENEKGKIAVNVSVIPTYTNVEDIKEGRIP